MRELINGKEAEWTPLIRNLWVSIADGRPEGEVVSANYFSPRPAVDEYNRGSPDEGFTYTVQNGYDRDVWQVITNRPTDGHTPREAAAPKPRATP